VSEHYNWSRGLKKTNLPLPGIQPQTHKCSATYGTWFSCRLTSVKVILA